MADVTDALSQPSVDVLKFEDSLNKLSIESVLVLQGALAQRGLQLLMDKAKSESKIIKPVVHID